MPSERAVPSVRRRLAVRIRTARKARGLSQDGLGEAAGLSGKFIGEVERGEKSITVDSLAHLADALKRPLTKMLEQRGVVPSLRRRRA